MVYCWSVSYHIDVESAQGVLGIFLVVLYYQHYTYEHGGSSQHTNLELIAPAFRSTLRTVTYDPEIGFLQKYSIPILDS
jgi:hypothetical protein